MILAHRRRGILAERETLAPLAAPTVPSAPEVPSTPAAPPAPPVAAEDTKGRAKPRA